MAFATEEIVNHYEVLGVEQDASEADIKRAHKLLARKVHPDKNPDDPKAAEKFHKVSKAREALLDPKQREELDKKLRAQKEKEEKYRKMNEKRRKMQEALEQREREGRSFMGTADSGGNDAPKKNTEDKKQRESREKNRKHRENVEERMKQKVQSSSTGNKASTGSSVEKPPEAAVKVQWNDHEAHILGLEGDTDACSQRLREMFGKYGEIANVICKSHLAIIEFVNGGSAAAATCNPPPGLDVTNPKPTKRAKTKENEPAGHQNGELSNDNSAQNPFYKPNIGAKSKSKQQNGNGTSSNGHHDFKKKEESILGMLKEKQRTKQSQTSS